MDCHIDEISATQDLYSIVEDLKVLGYNFDNWDFNFIKTSLTTPCSSRLVILCWVLKRLKFQYDILDLKESNSAVEKNITNDLVAVGICRPQDQNLIEGTASLRSQTQFWRKLIDLCFRENTEALSVLSSCSDDILDKVIHSRCYENAIKDEGLNFLPEDIKSLYRKANESVSINLRITNLNEELTERETSTKVEESQENEMRTLVGELSSLTAASDNFFKVYELSLRPWCKLLAVDTLSNKSLSETGKIALKCNEEIDRLLKAKSLTNNVESAVEQVCDKMKTQQQHSKNFQASNILESLVKAEGIAEIIPEEPKRQTFIHHSIFKERKDE